MKLKRVLPGRLADRQQKSRRSSVLRLARDGRGQGLVEFILALPIFVVLFFGIYEFSRYYSTRLWIRSAVAEGARFAATGNQLVDDEGEPLGRAHSIESTILSKVSRFGVTSGDIAIDPADGGGPEEIVTVSLDYSYEVAIPIIERVLRTDVLEFSVATSMRNEPFFTEES